MVTVIYRAFHEMEALKSGPVRKTTDAATFYFTRILVTFLLVHAGTMDAGTMVKATLSTVVMP